MAEKLKHVDRRTRDPVTGKPMGPLGIRTDLLGGRSFDVREALKELEEKGALVHSDAPCPPSGENVE
jgi:hypothetical protein